MAERKPYPLPSFLLFSSLLFCFWCVSDASGENFSPGISGESAKSDVIRPMAWIYTVATQRTTPQHLGFNGFTTASVSFCRLLECGTRTPYDPFTSRATTDTRKVRDQTREQTSKQSKHPMGRANHNDYSVCQQAHLKFRLFGDAPCHRSNPHHRRSLCIIGTVDGKGWGSLPISDATITGCSHQESRFPAGGPKLKRKRKRNQRPTPENRRGMFRSD